MPQILSISSFHNSQLFRCERGRHFLYETISRNFPIDARFTNTTKKKKKKVECTEVDATLKYDIPRK